MDSDDFIEFQTRPLAVEYVQGILEKFADTIDKYSPLIPEVDNFLNEVWEKNPNPEDQFSAVMTIIELLTKYKSTSPLMTELFQNVKMDFWHGLNESLPKHEGEFYIDSVAD
jgi:hypothetical protein